MRTHTVVITLKDAEGTVWTTSGHVMSTMVSYGKRAELSDLRAKGQVTIQDFQVLLEEDQ